MKRIRRWSETIKRKLAGFLAVILGMMVFVPYLPVRIQAAPDPGTAVTLTSAYGDTGLGHKLYCIDKGGLAQWGIADDGDQYAYHRPSEASVLLSLQEQRYVFWGMLTLLASLGDEKANQVIVSANAAAASQGLPAITSRVSEEDLKSLIYLAGTRGKYPWLETVTAHSEEYMRMGGLIGGGKTGVGGKAVPSVLAQATRPETAYQVDRNSFTISFDPSGADADFIRTVSIEFSNNNGASYSPVPTDGWTYTRTDTGITFHNPNPQPPAALIRFNVDGTAYAAGSGGYASEEEVIDSCLQLWECVACSGNHGGNTPALSDPWIHQRMVWMEIDSIPVRYYAALAGSYASAPGQPQLTFRVFRHEEEFTSTYNLQLYKYDHETGEPLEGARFGLYERFDDADEVDPDRDGPEKLYEGGAPYAGGYLDKPVRWEGFRNVGSLVTDSDGHVKKTVKHRYQYDKTFCDGHPAPVFTAVPEPEEDEETGEVLNQDAIDAAKVQNREMANAWLNCAAACEEKAGGDFEGVHFHWVMEDVEQGVIKEVSSSGGEEGETPDAGNTAEPSGETAYTESGCEADCQATYEKFISMEYSYTFSEFQARDGYVRHDLHTEDLPVEIITTDASENGANAYFAGEYGSQEKLKAAAAAASYRTITAAAEAAPSLTSETAARDVPQTAEKRTVPERILQKASAYLQEIIFWADTDAAAEETEEEPEEEESLEEEKPKEEENPEEKESKAEEEETGEAEKEEAEEKENPEEEDPEEEKEKESEAEEEEESEEEGEKTGEAEKEESEAEETENPEEKNPEAEESSEAEEEETGEAKEEESEAEEEKAEEEKTGLKGKEETKSETDSEEMEQEAEKAEISSHTVPVSRSAGPATASALAVRSDEEDEEKEAKEASSSNLSDFSWSRAAFSYQSPARSMGEEEMADLFTPAYEAALNSGSVGASVEAGPDDQYSHCSGADGEGNAWRVYDHRTEGEIHINKKDLDLAAGEDAAYSAYGDSQGDATLEGAVYGLFAAEDIVHPDGKTGTVYRKNNLVAVAATDRDGNASFLVNTEAPGHTYSYEDGEIVPTKDGWAAQAPGNLYVMDGTVDDYTEDGRYERTYYNNEEKNGNAWIGRPLFMGDYYVKELSRSEGYELSIENRQNPLTNLGQDPDVQVPGEAKGYAVIEQQMFADEQVAEEGEGARPNEIFFSARSKDTKDQKYDIVLTGLLEGVSVYRKETGTKREQVPAGTGRYEKVPLTNADGSPRYVVAEHDYQYPKYRADGTMMTADVPVNYVANQFRQVAIRELSEEAVLEVVNHGSDGMTEEENRNQLSRPMAESRLTFIKGKVEAALRRNGKSTPRSKTSGKYEGSSVYAGVFDFGVREGDPDVSGLSGVNPGEPAAYTVYGSPVKKLVLKKQKEDGTALTAGDAILSVLDYYNQNPYYSYGGVDRVEDAGDRFVFTVYAGVSGNPADFMVLGSDPVKDSVIYHAVPYLPEDEKEPPRYVYAAYSNNPARGAFGTYENYREKSIGDSVIGSATLITDAVVNADGDLESKTEKENVYYKAGETVYDSQGNPMQAYEYREITETVTQDTEVVKWVKIPAFREKNGSYVIPVDASYTDCFGKAHTNDGTDQTIEYKAVLTEKEVSLSAKEAEKLGGGFAAGHVMNSASYYVSVRGAKAKAYLDAQDRNLAGDNTYIVMPSLEYPGQEAVFQDAGTRKEPVQVYDRVIRQKIRIQKDILTEPDGSYAHNTNACSGHEDAFTLGAGKETDAAGALPGFCFKLYLKSNLERLYRDEDGTVVWLDRKGEITDPARFAEAFPKTGEYARVPRFYTGVRHKAASGTAGSRNNNVWESAILANDRLYSEDEAGFLSDDPNPGYTRLLETVVRETEGGPGETEAVPAYNYEKFFDAVSVANQDKWDRGDKTSTSFKPFAWIREALFGTGEGQAQDPPKRDNQALANTGNTSDAARENALRSDAVRQFAITWYLKDEVKKQTAPVKDGSLADGTLQAAGGGFSYQDELYDRALYQAILKAENYLKPFFACDLDSIYAIDWDSEKNGGADRDTATLSADTPCGNSYCGISAYLPYGTYLAVEQQPDEGVIREFTNQHYRTDSPKEIAIPSVYEPGGNASEPQAFCDSYRYRAADSPQEQAAKYGIRMSAEWRDGGETDGRQYVIQAHNRDGNFEVYKYGLDTGKLSGTVSWEGGSREYLGFSIAQEETDPYKDVYRSENEACRYRSNEAVGEYYHYASLSEREDTAKDGTETVTGALTGYDGQYYGALVPYSVTEPAEGEPYRADRFTGRADQAFHDTFYSVKLRLEKLDSETGEAVLHDSAVFAIYAAERDTSEEGDGRVLFYKKDTRVAGSREFLEAMGARDIRPVAEEELEASRYPWRAPYRGEYTGILPAGTPICREEEAVVMRDERGGRTGITEAFSTLRDLGKDRNPFTPRSQHTGYLVTPQPLGAGAYVICEMDAPSGYLRSRPVAVEIYSDEIAYYPDGDPTRRVTAAVYGGTARIYLNNTPLRLEVSKVKQDEKVVCDELDQRREGSVTGLSARYGAENLEFAFNDSGAYLGYAWPKGFLDMLKQLQAAGEKIEMVYEDGVFTGRALWSRRLETADDKNRYLPGASLALYDAIEIRRNGDREDRAYAGVNVERDTAGNVTRMYVEKGYAGNRVLFVKEKGAGAEDVYRYTYGDETEDRGSGIWRQVRVEREDTDILWYDLGDLGVFTEEQGTRFGYNRKGEPVRPKDGRPLYALKDGAPFLEIRCPDYGALHYNRKDRVFDRVPEGTEFFHLDAQGNRDARVDPWTGMAYVTEEKTGNILVWPVRISRDAYGNIIAREKIATSRIAAIGADTGEEYTIGTYKEEGFEKTVNPVLTKNGLPAWYPRSSERYVKGWPVFDRDHDFVRYRFSDLLNPWNFNAWDLNLMVELQDIGEDPLTPADDFPLYHRQGEAFLMENAWISGTAHPDDPFSAERSAGKADLLKRVPAGCYILEEKKAPSGYAKAMPAGVRVEETDTVQMVRMADRPVRVCFVKTDAANGCRTEICDYDGVLSPEDPGVRTEGKGSYTYRCVPGAVLALYPARRVSTTDLETYPQGYYLEKKSDAPASWTVLTGENQKKTVTARWTTGSAPFYLEGVPAGDYILEEESAPPGYLPASRPVQINALAELQFFELAEDHVKTGFYKYEEADGTKRPLPDRHAAKLALYEAVTDQNGIATDADGLPLYDAEKKVAEWRTSDCLLYTQEEDSFAERFQQLYEEYQTGFQSLSWRGYTAGKQSEFRTDREESVRQLWDLGDGNQALVQITRNLLPDGRAGYEYDFKFRYRKEGTLVSYDTPEGIHRLDYLALNGKDGTRGYYVLVEEETPDGYRTAAPKPIVVEAVGEIQLYGMRNEAQSVLIGKQGIRSETGDPIWTAGAQLALYRAGEDGTLNLSEEYEVERWISGADGVYTQEELEQGKIPDGFAAGDLRPHRIGPLACGTYYVAELSPPPGFVRAEPVKIQITDGKEECVAVQNQIKKGVIRLKKREEENPGKGLAGAVFEGIIQETGKRFYLVTDEAGNAQSPLLNSGTIGKTGKWEPYHFRIREIRAPKGYRLSPVMMDGQFADADETVLSVFLEAENAPICIRISKADFTKDILVKGAVLSVYETVLQDGFYQAAGEPLERWISDGGPHEICGKLTAGGSYLLKEEKAPSGYALHAPLLFTVADDGRGLSAVTDQQSAARVRISAGSAAAVEALTIQGRKAVGSRILLRDPQTGREWSYDAAKEVILTREDGFCEGARYELSREFLWSSGEFQSLGREFFRLRFDEDGRFLIPALRPEKTAYRLEAFAAGEESGSVAGEEPGEEPAASAAPVAGWVSENRPGIGYAYTIYNPEYEPACSLRVRSENGRDGAAVRPGSVIRYEVRCVNESGRETDLPVRAALDSGLEWMPANSSGGGKMQDGELVWTLEKMAPGESRTLILAAAVKPEEKGSIRTRVRIGAAAVQAENPIAGDNSLTLICAASGTASETLRKVTVPCRIFLRDREGNELLGTVSCQGAERTSLKSGEWFSLKGGQYLTLLNLPAGTVYEICAQLPDETEGSLKEADGIIGKEGKSAWICLHRNDPADREILRKNQSYRLTETIVWTDETGTERETETASLILSLNDRAQLDGFSMPDRPTRVLFSKTDLGGRELPGARLSLYDGDGTLLEEWISGEEPHEIEGLLEPGEEYLLREEAPPDGYAWEEEIRFRVSEDGTVDAVVMEDRPTRAEFTKYEISGERELPGARLCLTDGGGTVLERWVSSAQAHVIEGTLKAGETYCLREEAPPDGYWPAEDVFFTVPADGSTVRVAMRDRPTRVFVEKHALEKDGYTDAGLLPGACLRIRDAGGRIRAEWVSGRTPYCLEGVLTAGETYVLEEIEAPAGYRVAEPVSFTVPQKEEAFTVWMENVRITGKPGRPGNPERPHTPDQEETIGYLTVQIGSGLEGSGAITLRAESLSPLPKTGDAGAKMQEPSGGADFAKEPDSGADPARRREEMALGLLLLAGGLCFLYRAGRQKRQN